MANGMATDAYMRAVLGAVTCALVLYIALVRDGQGQGHGRPTDDRHFWVVVVSLAVVAALAADDCRAATARATSLLEGFEAQVGTLSSLPWKLYDTIAPRLEKLTGAIRGDGGNPDQATIDLKPDLYTGQADAPTLHAADGSVDHAKFDAMKLEYKRTVVFLCRMKTLAPDAHDALVTAMGGC